MSRTTLLLPRWLIPIEPRTVLVDHALVIEGDRIAAILPATEARGRWPQADVVNLPEHALLPGLINLHAHSAMTLLRGYADDLALMTWLNEHIWPAEGKHVSDEFVFDGTQLAIAEMIRGGTTCANDMYFHHGAVARAALTTGFRMMVGCSILEFPTPYAPNADAYLQKALACIDEFRGESLVGFTLAPHAPYTVSDATFSRVITLADELGIGIHCHIHETQDEIADSLKQHGVRPLERLANLGLLSGQLIAAHMVHMTDAEIALVARRGAHIAHNPASNLKLASGFARVADQLAAGINVGIGTDGAASNNKLDMFAELRLAALLAKGQSSNPEALPAWQALEMATINGAKALGWDERIGSLKAGKQADVIAVDLSALGTQPCFDPVSHLVYAADRSQVSHVWINGEQQLDSGAFTRIKQPQLVADARRWQNRIAASSTQSE
ncbi:TRZ/ATZ family hydrolase [Andreprevotia chitinilytica]|uniref:TRZ/ATZ family hydrolase n=1 Tax=Andreprevotia chitinilytica TaxID=396808 RepID=UPI000553DAB6|nr:TRZ/ATZ family hydrolase [Andreprevotia chitinilytica]